MLERTGAPTALVTTQGFRDIYEIGRVNRPDAYNLFFSKHLPLVPRFHRYEIAERLSASGEILTPLDEGAFENWLRICAVKRLKLWRFCFCTATAIPTMNAAPR